MRNAKRLPLVLLPLWLAACVTINVYFPAAAAEKAADRFIQDVYGQQPEKEAPETQEQPENTSSKITPHALAVALVDLIIPPAQAAADIDISTPAIQALKQSMIQRQARLRSHYDSGAVGMTRDGLITLRDAGAVPLSQRNQVRQLVSAENRDRNALYREIAKANGHPEWESDIRKTFAQRWVANAPSGWWYQDNSGNWKQK